MSALKYWIGLLILILGSLSQAADILNLGPDFTQFLLESQNQPEKVVLDRLLGLENKNASLYRDAIYSMNDPEWQQKMDTKRKSFLAALPVMQTQMVDIFAKAGSIVANQESHFRTLFPDLPSDIPVVFMISYGAFNGQVREVSLYKKMPLLIGVDFVVQRNDDLDVLFSHEFFHAYHVFKLAPGSNGRTMATPLWKEGFATYISGVLNPGKSDAVLLMDKKLAQTCSDPQEVAKMATLYLQVLNTDGANSYEDWFLLKGQTQPPRRGYCLGLRVIRKIAENHKLEEMVTWGEAHFSYQIETVLKEFAEKK